MKGNIMPSIKQRLALRSNLSYHYRRYRQWVGNLDKKDLKVKFLSYLGIVFGVLLLSWVISFVLSGLPAWNSNIDTIEKLKNVSFFSILTVLFRLMVVALFIILYWKAALPFWNERPIKRDRSLFARSGWGMAVYSLGAIILVICILMTWANLMKANTVFPPKPELRTDYPEDFGIIKRSWDVICQFADPGNIHSSTNFQGNVIALISAFAGILCLSGLAVSALVSMIARRTQQWKQGLIRYEHGFKNYVVIIGVNEQTSSIVKSSLNQVGVEYVLIQTRKNVEDERAKLELYLEHKDEEKIVFYFGDRALYEDIEDLNLEYAKEVYILGEDMSFENEEDHDSYNITCLEHIARYAKESFKHSRLKCHVNMEYQSTFMAFKFTHIYRNLNEKIEFIPFNVHEIWAKKVLVDNYAIIPSGKHSEKKVQRYLPLDAYWERDTEKDSKELRYIDEDSQQTVHLVVVGMNQMGVALAMQTALLVHLPNYQKFRNRNLRTTISFIDDNAIKEGEYLRGRYDALFSLCQYRVIMAKDNKDDLMNSKWIDPMENGRYSYLGENFMDVQWEFIEGNVASPAIRKYLSMLADDTDGRTTTIAVCFNNPQQSIATALYLPEIVLRRALQILVYQQNSFEMINKVATGEREWKRYEKLRPFGMMEDCYKGNMFENTLAKLALKVYRDKTLQYSNIDNLIDYLNRLWGEEGIVAKLANINLVDSFSIKLRSVGLRENSPVADINKVLCKKSVLENMDMAEHSRWLTERLTMGYRPLDEEDMQYFLSPDNSDFAKKAKKEYYKSKNRAHLDICSYTMLCKVDKTLLNDQLIIKNLLKRRFYKVEREFLCRLAFRSQKEKTLRNDRTSTTWEFIKDMVEVPERKQKLNKVKMWMGAYTVTQSLWERIMGTNPAKNKGNNYPIENVSKDEIEDFLFILNDITGLKFHLPEKEEWLYAALGGEPSYTFDTTAINNIAWTRNNSDKQSHEVGKKQANLFKIYDMLGNVWEWTRTKHGPSTFYFCGGSWRFSEKECDLSDKNDSWCSYWTPEFKSADLGFRLVLHHEFKKDVSQTNQVWIPEKKKILYEIIKNMKMVEGGCFNMGTSEKKLFDGTSHNELINILPDETPEHLLEMSEFYISDSVVTQRQWVAFMGENENPSGHKGYSLPVENVSYVKAGEFIKVLNDYCRRVYNLSFDCFDLPTEAQWEFAAKGGGKYSVHSTIYSGGDYPDELAWHYGITKCTHPVRSKRGNDIKLYDMCGNVWEWCKDWYQADYYHEFSKGYCKKTDLTYPRKDPEGPSVGCARTLRGGSWRFTAGECRLTRRSYWIEDYEADDVGFRLVSTPKGSQFLSELIKKVQNEQPDSSVV